MTGAAPKRLNLQFNPPRTIFVPKVAVLNDPTTGGARPASEPSWTLPEPLQHLRRLLGSKTRPVEAAQRRPLTLISFRLSPIIRIVAPNRPSRPCPEMNPCHST